MCAGHGRLVPFLYDVKMHEIYASSARDYCMNMFLSLKQVHRILFLGYLESKRWKEVAFADRASTMEILSVRAYMQGKLDMQGKDPGNAVACTCGRVSVSLVAGEQQKHVR
jgi:hypothetical protein